MNLMSDGTGCFSFADEPTGKSLTVRYHRPAGSGAETPLVLLLHGSDRAAAYFLTCWSEHADKYGFVLAAPEFDDRAFPGGEAYNYGNVQSADGPEGTFNPPHLWTYAILDRLLDCIRRRGSGAPAKCCLFGHSAGAQFAHRYLALTGGRGVDFAVLANAGWYMLPDPGTAYPAGVGGLEVSRSSLDEYLGRAVALLLGEDDVDENDPGLAPFPAARAQGRHRLARGQYYFAHCRDAAGRRGVPFGWRIVTAPGVGHRDDHVSGPGAALIAEYLSRENR